MPIRPPTHRPAGYKPYEKRPDPAHSYYKTKEWRELRAFVWKRDKGTCVKCGERGRTVDHIVERKLGGPDHPSNLRVMCGTCDNKRHPEKGYQ